MTRADHQALRQAMEKAAALPPEDPRRQEVLERVEAAGEWAREEWAELVSEAERLRLALRDVPAPEGLPQRLKAIPAQTQATPPRAWGRRYRTAAVLAAACLLLAAGLLVNLRSQPPALEQTKLHLARLAVEDHAERPELSISSGEPEQVAHQLQPHVAFAVNVPPIDHALSLVGGRICSFEERPIAHTRWRYDGETHSLYQLAAADFDLPEQFMPIRIEVPAVPGQSQAYDVLIWSAGECAYVMVCEGPLPIMADNMGTGGMGLGDMNHRPRRH